jgi:hypothetical protein
MGVQGDHYPAPAVDVDRQQAMYVEDMIKMGVESVRVDSMLHWAEVERGKGVFDLTGYGIQERYLGLLTKHDIEPMVILCYGNPFYDQGPNATYLYYPPTTPGGIKAFGEYCYRLVKYYHNEVKYWEIWNEPNTTFWPPRADVVQYMALLREASRRIHEADPEAFVISGGAWAVTEKDHARVPNWYTPESWYEKCFAMGLKGLVSAIGVHLYRIPPEGGDDVIQDLKAILKKYDAQNMAIWDTEDGYDADRFGQVVKAKYLARLFLNNYAQGVEKTFWFYMGWDNPSERGQDLAPFDSHRNPLPAFFAYRSVSEVLRGCPTNETTHYQFSFEPEQVGYRQTVQKYLRYYIFQTKRPAKRTLLAVWLKVPGQESYPEIRVFLKSHGRKLAPSRVLDTLSGQWSVWKGLDSNYRDTQFSLSVADYPLVYELR